MKKKIFADKKILLLPYCLNGNEVSVDIFCGNDKIYEFEIILPGKKQDILSYVQLPVDKWFGMELIISGEFNDVYSDHIMMKDDFSSFYSTTLHFHSQLGWINDPNGLFFLDGVYHVYFQHNPFATKWGNMSWGHVVTKDFILWKQLSDVLFPDENGMKFSGSAILSPLKGVSEKQIPIFMYTNAGGTSLWSRTKKFDQRIAYSLDNGTTFVCYPCAVLPFIKGENRDPKVYYDQKENVYYFILYLDENEFAIFISNDLVNWKESDRFKLGGNAWECPDIFPLDCNDGSIKWIITTADGFYYVGRFENFRFYVESGPEEMHRTLLAYAGQSFAASHSRIMISWLRTKDSNCLYRGRMSIPRKLSLKKIQGKYFIAQSLPDELIEKRIMVEKAEFSSIFSSFLSCSICEICVHLDTSGTFSFYMGSFSIYIGNGKLYARGLEKLSDSVRSVFSKRGIEQILENDESQRCMAAPEFIRDVSIIVDNNIIEVSINDGLYLYIFELADNTVCTAFKVETDCLSHLEVYCFKSES